MNKKFKTEVVMSAHCGYKICDDIVEVKELLDHVLNQDVYSSDFKEAWTIVQPFLEGLYPWLAFVIRPGMSTVRAKRKVELAVKRFGEELDVPQLKDVVRRA